MRSFATVAVLTAIVGLLIGAGLAATDPTLAQGGSVALAASETQADGFLGGMLQMVTKPLMRAFNVTAGPVVKVEFNQSDQKQQKLDQGKADKPAQTGQGGGNRK